MKRRAISNASVILVWSIVITIPTSGLTKRLSRVESEKNIRTSAYEMMKAFLTQDVATFKRYAARRTLELTGLVYEAARQDPRYQRELETARITNADQFLGYFMLGMATQYFQAVPLSPKAAARQAANDSNVLFISDSEARIIVGDTELARAKLVARKWKVDLADWLKRFVLKEVQNPELRAKIEHL